MTSIPVHRHEKGDAPAQIEGPHITWTPATFVGPLLSSGVQEHTKGAQLWLCVGRRTLATAEFEGTTRQIIDACDREADRVAPWMTTTTQLAASTEAHVAAETLTSTYNGWADAAEQVRNASPGYNTDPDKDPDVLRMREFIRALVPADAVVEHGLVEGAALHRAALVTARDDALRHAVLAMPSLDTAIPTLGWTPMYKVAQIKEIQESHNAELPRLLLRGWSLLANDDDRPDWDRGQEVATRDFLIRWAATWGLPKSLIYKASRVARTTIDRVLTGSAHDPQV
ncbi:hypothetical protein ACIF6L_34650 [Kitasatospora sp. NPDC086009]|uniref:hypothetical protein n=1 Tax=unclassified Kitasatospora TaxID=2633591 RepID=UPI0037C8A5B7